MKKNFSKTVVIVMAITLFARIFGLLREILIARYYGTSIYTDAYIIANNIPTVLFDTLGQALLTSFIPMYSRICHEVDEKRANIFTVRLIIYLMFICLAFTIMGEVFAKELVWIFASGFKGEALNVTIQFTRILFPSIFAMTLLNLFTGYLQIYDKFEMASVVTVIGNIIIIFALWISNFVHNVYIFVWGSLVGIFFQVIFLIPSVIKIGLFNNRKRGSIFQRDRYVKMLLPLLIPVFIGSALNEINSIIDRTMVSGIGTGAVSTLNYAYKVISLTISVIALPLITIMYPQLSVFAAENDENNFENCVYKCVNYIMAIIVPISVVVYIYRNYIIKILFERGSFNSTATTETAQVLACYALGLTAMAIQQILIRVFYSKQNTFTPMVNGIICAIVNIGLDYILIKKCGFSGAALATSIVAIIACIILILLLAVKKIVSIKKIVLILIKNFVSGIVMLLFLICGSNKLVNIDVLNLKNILIVLVLTVMAIIIYLLMQIITKNNEVTHELCKLLKTWRSEK